MSRLRHLHPWLCATSPKRFVIYYIGLIQIQRAKVVQDTSAIGGSVIFYAATIYSHCASIKIDNPATLVCCFIPDYAAVFNIHRAYYNARRGTTFAGPVVNAAPRVCRFIS